MMDLAAVRKDVLRRFLGATYGHSVVKADAVKDATFNEYHAMMRIFYPLMPEWRAAEEAPTSALRAHLVSKPAGRIPPLAAEVPLGHFVEVKRQPAVDLRTVAIPDDVGSLSLRAIRSVSGWEGLARFKKLQEFWAIDCRGASSEVARTTTELQRLRLNDSDGACVKAALGAVRASQIAIATSRFDARLLHEQTTLEKVSLRAELVQNVGALGPLPIRSLSLGAVVPNASVTKMLRQRAKELTELRLSGTTPFGPNVLPDLRALETLRIPGYPEYRDEWIEWALEHRAVVANFGASSDNGVASRVKLAELHSGIEILKIEKGKRVSFELSGDFASEISRFQGDNGDLEDEMKALAKKAKKRVTWSSEADTFVAIAADLETARWLAEHLAARGGDKASDSA